MKESQDIIPCPRCGGTGKTEHSHVMFGICFLCKGSGQVSELTVDRTERKLEQKRKAKDLNDKKAVEVWENNHAEAKANFDSLVDKSDLDLTEYKKFNFCVGMLKHLGQEFTKANFEDILETYAGTLHIEVKCRIALVKYFRANGVYNSKFEYDNSTYDYKTFCLVY